MFSIRRFVSKSKPMLRLWGTQVRAMPVCAIRQFSTAAEMSTVEEDKEIEHMTEEERLIAKSKKFGADLAFNERKHGYILSFPWNFDEVIQDYEHEFAPLDEKNFWYKWIYNREVDRDFNELFRVFHQACAIPEESGLIRVCEPRFLKYVKSSLENIHFHGMDIELANFRTHQPKIDILNVELYHGLSVDRNENRPIEEYDVTDSSILGAPVKVFTPKSGDTRSIWDNFDEKYKPYVVSVTALIHSPMKLYVLNQNRSKILFGSDDQEVVKNVVKFEANVRWTEFFKILPVPNKPLLSRAWKIVDYNKVMNENPLPQ
jgi:hypothetical protein